MNNLELEILFQNVYRQVARGPHFSSNLCTYWQTPLDTSVIDVAVFCLSLMGTNFASYLKEAHRVLKPGFAPILVQSFHIT